MSDKGQQAAIITGGSQGIGASLVAAYRWVAEQAPERLLAALTAFLAPTGTGRPRRAAEH